MPRPSNRGLPGRRQALLATALPVLLTAALAAPALAQHTPTTAGIPAGAAPAAAGAPDNPASIVPPFTIWDVKLGQPVSSIPDRDIVNVACGTNGGPIALKLTDFSEFAKCPAEPSGLHEVHFEYDDEQAYVAKALQLEYRFLQAGTSVYAHPVVVSVLVDDKGIAQGIRILTDDTASLRDRRGAAGLEDNFKARFSGWSLDCQKPGPADGEEALGGVFVHDICTGKDPAGTQQFRLEARYMRLKGQLGIDPDTQKVLRESFFSQTRFELVNLPYQPAQPLRPEAPPAGAGAPGDTDAAAGGD